MAALTGVGNARGSTEAAATDARETIETNEKSIADISRMSPKGKFCWKECGALTSAFIDTDGELDSVPSCVQSWIGCVAARETKILERNMWKTAKVFLIS